MLSLISVLNINYLRSFVIYIFHESFSICRLIERRKRMRKVTEMNRSSRLLRLSVVLKVKGDAVEGINLTSLLQIHPSRKVGSTREDFFAE